MNGKNAIWYSQAIDNSGLKKGETEAKAIWNQMGNDAEKTGARISNIWKGVLSTAAIAGFVKQMVKYRGEFQQLEIAFTTMLKSGDKAKKLMSDLTQFAAETPFGLQSAASGAKQLIAYGSTAESVIGELRMLGDVAAGTGQSINDLVYLYGTLRTQGRAFAMDIRQFAGRGIPIYDELAKVLNTSKDKVNEFVTAGKVGFAEIEQAFKNMTSAGGMYGGLMEEQSKSVTGRIEQLRDAIDMMFNDIGKSSEGIIYSAISGATSLVENYEKIGKVLAGLITTYGTYKAVLIATASIQKSNIILGEVRAFLQLTKAIKSAKDAQLLLNMAMKSNPLIMLASIVAGITAAVSSFRKRTDEAADSVLGLARAQKTAGEEFDKEAAKVKALQDVMNNGKVAYDARKKALNELKGIIPGYNAQLTEEGVLINNNTDAIKAYLTQLERQIKMKAAQEELEEAYRQKRQLEKERIEKEETLRLAQDYQYKITPQKSDSKVGTALANAMFGNTSVINDATAAVNRAQGALDNIDAKLRDNASVIAELNREIETTGTTTGGASDGISTFAEQLATATQNVESLGQELAKLRSGETPSADYAKDIAEKEKELKDAQGRLNTLLGIDPKRLKADTDEARKYLDEYEKIVLSARERLASEEVQLERDKIEDKLALIEFDRKQTIIAIEQTRDEALKAWVSGGKSAGDFDGSIFQDLINQANIRAEFDTGSETAERVKQKQEELDALLKEFRSYEQQRVAIVEEYDNKIAVLRAAGANEAAEAAEQAKSKALAELSQSMIEESDLWVRLFEDASKMTTSQIENIIAETQNLLDYLQGKEGAEIPIGFSEEDLKSLKGSPEAIKKIIKALDEMNKGLNERKPFEALSKSLGQLKTATDAEKEAQEAYNQALREGTEEEKKNALATLESAKRAKQRALADATDALQSSVGKVREYVGIAEDLIGVVNQFGIEPPEWMEGYLEGMGKTLDGLGSIDLTKPMSIVSGGIKAISGMIKTVTSLGGIINWNGSNAKDVAATINRLTDRNELLQYAIEDLTDEIKASKGTKSVAAYRDAYKYQQETNENYLKIAKAQAGYSGAHHSWNYYWKGFSQEQIDKLSSQIGRSWDGNIWNLSPEEMKVLRSNVDMWTQIQNTGKGGYGGRLTEKLNDYIDQASKLEELTDKLYEGLTGMSFESMYDSFVDALMDMDATAEDFADNISEYFMRAMLANKIGEIYSEQLEDWWNKFGKAMEDNDLSDAERNALYDEYMSYVNEAIMLRDKLAAATGYDNLNKNKDDREGTSKGIATASQDSVDELNGRMTVMQQHTYELRENSNVIRDNSTNLVEQSRRFMDQWREFQAHNAQVLRHLSGIESNTNPIPRMAAHIEDMATKGVKIRPE